MSLVEFSTTRRVTIVMMSITLLLFGLIALFRLQVNLLPDLSYPTLTVRTEYVGAAPSEIETLISEPLEQSLGVVKGLRRIHSISRMGQSDVMLEFAWGADMDKASLEVRDKLEVLTLPLQANQPVLLRFDPSTEPVVRMALSMSEAKQASMSADAKEARLMSLRRYADEELQKKLEPIPGVASVKIAGGLEDEVQVLIDQNELAARKLSIDLIGARLKAENVNISGGQIEDGNRRYLVRTINEFNNLDDMRNMVVTTIDGVPIRLNDVATVVRSHKERDSVIRVDGDEAIELAIYKEGDANTVMVADAIKKALGSTNQDGSIRDALPSDYQLTIIEDQSIFIHDALSEVRAEAVIGGLLAILMIFLFLRDGWSTLVIGLSLPLSIIATFFFMGQLGLSLNLMSLAGLALATGMVVDDSIVVLESIAKARERGLGVLEAAVTGTKEVNMAVVASTLTTVAVFLPLVFVEGVAGQLFKDQALTVSIALVISLVVALTLIPMLSSIKAKAPMAFADHDAHDGSARNLFAFTVPGIEGSSDLVTILNVFTWVFRFVWEVLALLLRVVTFSLFSVLRLVGKALSIVVGMPLGWAAGGLQHGYAALEARYHGLLQASLKQPVIVLGIAAIMLVVAGFLGRQLGSDLIPQFAQDRFELTMRLTPGTLLEDTDVLMKQVQLEAAGIDGVDTVYGVVGQGARMDANPTDSGEHIAKLSVVMGNGFTKQSEALAQAQFREGLQGLDQVEYEFNRPQLLSFKRPVQIEVQGRDLDALKATGDALVDMLSDHPHFSDVQSSMAQGYPEVRIEFDEERAAALGLTSRDVADQIVSKLRGDVATRYSFRSQKIDVLVRSQEDERQSVQDIGQLIVNPGAQYPVTLASVATITPAVGPSEIHRADQTRVVLVESDLNGIDLGAAIQEINAMVAANPLPNGQKMHLGGQSEELDASVRSLLFAFGLAVFLVYLVMASQFESLLHPFVILFTIPLALVGAVLALRLSGSPVSVVVFIGVILLVGIVVKNAIVLIDRVNQWRLEGMNKRAALVKGSTERLRPIVMTTLTTLIGFMPLAFMGGAGAEVKAPMAITVIGGLAVSTLLTLVVIPVVYDLLDRRSDEKYRKVAEDRIRLQNMRFDDAEGAA